MRHHDTQHNDIRHNGIALSPNLAKPYSVSCAVMLTVAFSDCYAEYSDIHYDGATALSITTISRMTLSRMTFSIILNKTRHSAQWQIIVMLSVIFAVCHLC